MKPLFAALLGGLFAMQVAAQEPPVTYRNTRAIEPGATP